MIKDKPGAIRDKPGSAAAAPVLRVVDMVGRDVGGDEPGTGGGRMTPQEVSLEMSRLMDPSRVAPEAMPWTPEGRARNEARKAGLQARLDLFKDDLTAIRKANEALSRAQTMRALEAAEAAVFEIRTLGETLRFTILNRAHLAMSIEFAAQLERFEGLRGRLPVQILEALKERALEEFTARMNRASKSDVEFDKGGMWVLS